MGLPSTGSISMSQVNTELKKSAIATISLNDSAVRKLAGKTSGTISMNDLRGKSNTIQLTNYVLFKGKKEGERKKDTLTLNLPNTAISGTLTIKCSPYYTSPYLSKWNKGYVSYNSSGNFTGTRTFNVNDVKTFNIAYYTGECSIVSDSQETSYPAGVDLEVTFTGTILA